ncbi:MAG: energy transducer TonB [Pseudomonadales bacterium]|nr:energy transducer TonB [Pseudomonadales bacterium]
MEFMTSYTFLLDPIIQLGLDALFKSAILISVVFVVLSIIRNRISSTSAHLILLGTFVCIALVPIVALVTRATAVPLAEFGTLAVFTVGGEVSVTTSAPVVSVELVLVIAYLVGTLVLLGLLGNSARQLTHLHLKNFDIENSEVQERFVFLVNSIGIQRPVKLQCNAEIQSPLSYGLLKPVVVVPETFLTWEDVIQTEVLMHELNHIKRLDWLSLIFTRALCSLLWINPLMWIAAKRLHDESEQACDSAIATNEHARIRYAEDLLHLAKQQQLVINRHLLAQPMFDGGELTMRINNILEGKTSRGVSQATLGKLSIAVLFVAIVTGSTQLFKIEAASALDRDYLPIYSPAPDYPTRAIDDEAEGWILFSFTVTASGIVAPATVNVVDANPSGYFEESSRTALLNFEFEPRVENGIPVDVPGVQYLFRYVLHEDENSGFEDEPESPTQ